MHSPTLRCKYFPCEMRQLFRSSTQPFRIKKWGSIYPVELRMGILDNQKGKSQELAERNIKL